MKSGQYEQKIYEVIVEIVITAIFLVVTLGLSLSQQTKILILTAIAANLVISIIKLIVVLIKRSKSAKEGF